MSSTKRTSFIGSISVTPAASPEAVEKLYRAKRGGSVKEEILSEDSPYKEQLEFIKLNNGSFGSVFSSQISMRRDPFSRALLSFMHWKEDFFNPKFEYLYQNLGENVRVVNGGLFLVSSVFIITTLLVLVYVTNVQVSGIWLVSGRIRCP